MLFVIFKVVYKMHKTRLSFCSWNFNFSKMNFSKRVTILNLFLFRKLKKTPISSKSVKLSLIHIQFFVEQQIYMQMQQLSVHFSSPSSNVGKSLYITSTELALDMTRMCHFMFQTTPNPSYFRVPDFCMTVHLQLFQILLRFHNNNNRF